jgi:hypothetical protein
VNSFNLPQTRRALNRARAVPIIRWAHPSISHTFNRVTVRKRGFCRERRSRRNTAEALRDQQGGCDAE